MGYPPFVITRLDRVIQYNVLHRFLRRTLKFWGVHILIDLRKNLDREYKNLLFEGIYSEPGVFEIEEALIRLAEDKRVQNLVPEVAGSLFALREARDAGDMEKRETELLSLYLALHGAGSRYKKEEKDKFRASQGIECLPGGILPLVLSSCLIDRGSVVADLGCGNGLQGLLLQMLRPHQKTVQAELCGELISTGRLYQEILGLDTQSVKWFHGDISEVLLGGVDLVYMYRPVRPSKQGFEIYRKIAERISALPHAVRVISLADCLNGYLGDAFYILYQNDFLTVFSSVEAQYTERILNEN
jgi:hypothetical protein